MDGTLLDSIEAVEAAWRTLADEEGIDIGRMREFHGRPARDIVADLFPPDRRDAVRERLDELEAAPGHEVRRLPGVQPLLDALPHDRWAIVTSATRRVAVSRIAASRIPAPQVLVTAESVTRGKPDPEPFLVARRWVEGGVPALAVEDSLSGLAAARAAGCLTIGVLGTEPLGALLTQASAVVRSLADVTASVGGDGSLEIDLVAITADQG